MLGILDYEGEYTLKTLLTTLNAKYVQSSLALRCLRTSCEKLGYDGVVTAEYTINHNAYDILRHIYAFHADVIGFSCYIWNIENDVPHHHAHPPGSA